MFSIAVLTHSLMRPHIKLSNAGCIRGGLQYKINREGDMRFEYQPEFQPGYQLEGRARRADTQPDTRVDTPLSVPLEVGLTCRKMNPS